MHGQNISIDCNMNYELEGNVAQITCNNGTFNKMPRCEPARCKDLPSPPNNGMVVVSTYFCTSFSLLNPDDDAQNSKISPKKCNL